MVKAMSCPEFQTILDENRLENLYLQTLFSIWPNVCFLGRYTLTLADKFDCHTCMWWGREEESALSMAFKVSTGDVRCSQNSPTNQPAAYNTFSQIKWKRNISNFLTSALEFRLPFAIMTALFSTSKAICWVANGLIAATLKRGGIEKRNRKNEQLNQT